MRSILVVVFVVGSQAQTVIEVASVDRFTEGPVFDYDGNLFFSEPDRVLRLTPDDELSTWLEASANGHKVLADGSHLICSPGAGGILHVSPNGAILGEAATECDGRPLSEPNDLTLDGADGFYFTDPGGTRDKPTGIVCHVDAQRNTRLVAAGIWVANGLVLSLDRRSLYVGETLANRILEFEVTAPGILGPAEIFARLPDREGHQAAPDGMAIDSDGNLYVAQLGTGSVRVLNPRGELIRTLPAGVYDASNLVFAGPNLDQLFVTGSVGHRRDTPGKVYRIDLDGVRGVSPLLPR